MNLQKLVEPMLPLRKDTHAHHAEAGKERQAALEHVRSQMKSSSEGEHASFGSDYGNKDIEAHGNEHEMGVRDYGRWESEPENRGNEDDDHKVPTKATVDKVRSIVAAAEAKHPNVKLHVSGGEKNWTYIRATSKGKT